MKNGFYSVSDLAKASGISGSTIRHHAKKMNWPLLDGKLKFSQAEFNYRASWLKISTSPRTVAGKRIRKGLKP